LPNLRTFGVATNFGDALVLKWCAYCRKFMAEVLEYDDFSLTHGMCAECEAKSRPSLPKPEFDHAVFLREIFRKLFNAGKRNDFEAAQQIVDDAITANCRPVDILIGMIAPMLYQIGEDWKRGVLSVDGEHRFTAFCERVCDLIADKMKAKNTAPPTPSSKIPVILINAPGNRHNLSIRILALWLESQRIKARIADSELGSETLVAQLATRPKLLLISMALTEQSEGVEEIVNRILAWPKLLQPRIIVGGYAVKVGLVSPIPGVEMTADIQALKFT